MRKKRDVQAGKCYHYHLVSRVAHRAFFFDDDEKNRFVDLLMRVEFFSCVRVLAYCCMSNHIHVFIYLDDARELSEEEILARVNALYRGARLAEALGEWKVLRGGTTRQGRVSAVRSRVRISADCLRRTRGGCSIQASS